MVELLKDLPANAGNPRDVDSIPGLGRSPGGGNGNRLQYFCMGNSMDRGAWRATVHGVGKSETRLSACAHTHTFSVVGGCSLYCRMFSNIFVLHPLDVSSNYSVVKLKLFLDIAKCPLEGKIIPCWTPLGWRKGYRLAANLFLQHAAFLTYLTWGIVQGSYMFFYWNVRRSYMITSLRKYLKVSVQSSRLSSVQDLWKHW